MKRLWFEEYDWDGDKYTMKVLLHALHLNHNFDYWFRN